MKDFRLLGALAVLSFGGPGTAEEVPVCDDGASKCKTFPTRDDAAHYIEAYHQAALARTHAAAQEMPIDPRDCGLPVLVDAIRQSGAVGEKDAQIYVSLIGEDIDAGRRSELRRQGVTVRPASKLLHDSAAQAELQRSRHTLFWDFDVAVVGAGPTKDEYEYGAGYHCGTLCFARVKYLVKVNGATCSIVSTEVQGMS